jgi:hypothetical protein
MLVMWAFSPARWRALDSTDLVAPTSLMNRFRLTGVFRRPSPPWRPAHRPRAASGGPGGVVLVVDDLVATSVGFLRPGGRPGLGDHLPVGDPGVRWSVRHFLTW